MVGPGGENPLGLGCCPFRATGRSPTSPGETSAALLRQLWLYLELLSLCEGRGEKQNEPRNYLFSTTQTMLCFLLHVIISIPGFGSLHQTFSCNFFSFFILCTRNTTVPSFFPGGSWQSLRSTGCETRAAAPALPREGPLGLGSCSCWGSRCLRTAKVL